jgi:transketolase
MSVGIELLKPKKLNNDDHLVYTLHGDGELQEGQNWEAIMYASAKKSNLIATIDLNGKQIDGATDEVLPMGSIRAKFEAFDWDVLDIKEGIEAIIAGMTEAKSRTGKGKPLCYCILKWGMGWIS